MAIPPVLTVGNFVFCSADYWNISCNSMQRSSCRNTWPYDSTWNIRPWAKTEENATMKLDEIWLYRFDGFRWADQGPVAFLCEHNRRRVRKVKIRHVSANKEIFYAYCGNTAVDLDPLPVSQACLTVVELALFEWDVFEMAAPIQSPAKCEVHSVARFHTISFPKCLRPKFMKLWQKN
jgi:hypothetical protein